ncbi:MAG: lamin tail domain-containing protein [Anaerolineales bacterium]
MNPTSNPITHLRYTTLVALLLLAGLFLLPSCQPAPETPAPPSQPEALISEVLAGVEGDNLYEYIELYNPGSERQDIYGWSLEYQLNAGGETIPLYVWQSPASIPPHGHLLLVHRGFDVGVQADGYFDQALNLSRGGLRLLDAEGLERDALGWGEAPAGFFEGNPAPELDDGISLERNPGGPAGNGQNQGDNLADFMLQTRPVPQNSGSPGTPDLGVAFQLELQSPETLAPGDEFELSLTLRNNGQADLTDLTLQLPLPEDLEVQKRPNGVVLTEGLATWNSGELPAGSEQTWTFELRAPWTYLTFILRDVFARSETGEYAYAEPAWIQVKEGVIPVNVARDLVDSQVMVEGIATMYTGGYFAGSGNVKFYMEDDTAGVQVWVPSGEGSLQVEVGDRVRVTGEMQIYRNARELVASPETVGVLEKGPGPEGFPATIQQASQDSETLPGRLISLEGTATRIEEFSYSYEVDLSDAAGNLITLYVDKLTGINVEPLEIGREYRATGILEITDTENQLYPRFVGDIEEIYPKEILLTADAPLTVQPGEIFTLTLKASNYTDVEQTDLELVLPWPQPSLTLIENMDKGVLDSSSMRWRLPALEPGGDSASVQLRVRPAAGEFVSVIGASILDAEGELLSEGSVLRVFLGQEIPIWALQGTGDSTPYKLKSVTTSGIVTGAFPGLSGFWIQNREPDDERASSEGLYVSCGEDETLTVQPGDWIQITGVMREIASQTQLAPQDCSQYLRLATGLSLPDGQPLDPPADPGAAQAYYESLEGMLVELNQPALVVGPTSRFGETFLVLEKHGVTRLFRGDPMGYIIVIDDGSSETFEDRSGQQVALASGDRVLHASGPLAYTFGAYKIEPILTPDAEPGPPAVIPDLIPAGADEFSIMTWNVENLFDILAPHPSSPPRPRKAEYDRDLIKIANTIEAAGGPTVVALQEVENLGILEDLVGLDLLAPYHYQPYLLEGTDSRGIDVGYLVRTDRVDVLEVTQFPAPGGLTSRPPLMLRVRFREHAGELVLFNNHFLSMSGGEAATEPRRTAQAAWNADLAADILAENPAAWVGVLGDLNSYYGSLPIETLRQAGLNHVFDILPEDERYTYIYLGVSQTLDHIMVSDGLWQQLESTLILHLDADQPLPTPEDSSPLHASDHDPVIATFSLP